MSTHNYFATNTVYFGDCIDLMRQMKGANTKAQMCVTSPPYYGLRDYGVKGQYGLEGSPEEYIANMVQVFRAVRDILSDDGTLWLNIGDSYAANRTHQVKSTKGGPKHSESQSVGARASVVPNGMKPKDLIGIPWMMAFALRADGWYLRQDIIWHKTNAMPESVKDRCTKSHEYLFLLSKSPKYFFDSIAMQEPATAGWCGSEFHKGKTAGHQVGCSTKRKPTKGADADKVRNRRSVWSIATKPYKGSHFATFPPALVDPCIRAGSRPGDVVLDPFMGSGTTAAVAIQLGREYLGCELNKGYRELQSERLASR